MSGLTNHLLDKQNFAAAAATHNGHAAGDREREVAAAAIQFFFIQLFNYFMQLFSHFLQPFSYFIQLLGYFIQLFSYFVQLLSYFIQLFSQLTL